MLKWITITASFLLLLQVRAENKAVACSYTNTAFRSGEWVQFHVYYTLAGVWVHAGNVTFTANLEQLNGKPVYHIIGDGSTKSSYDWIYKVRDRYESYVDTATLLPKRFIRNINEGGFTKYENISFNHEAGIANTQDGSFKVPNCVQDVLSEVYLARNIDFRKSKPNDLIPFDLFLDNKVYNMYIRYVGRETIKTRFGKFKCIKFKPLLLSGTIFEGGEKMTVWVTDDENRLPVRVESPITVGSVKVDMMGYRNLRHPISALISR